MTMTLRIRYSDDGVRLSPRRDAKAPICYTIISEAHVLLIPFEKHCILARARLPPATVTEGTQTCALRSLVA